MMERISGIELFGFDIGGEGQPKRRFGLLRVTCDGTSGWSECYMSESRGGFDFIRWAYYLLDLRGLTAAEIKEQALRNRAAWGEVKSDLILDALHDLEARQLRLPGLPLTSVPSVQPRNLLAAGVDRPSPIRVQLGTSALAASPVTAAELQEDAYPQVATGLMKLLQAVHTEYLNGGTPVIDPGQLIGPGRTALQLCSSHLGGCLVEDGVNWPTPIGSLQSPYGTGFEANPDVLIHESRAYFSVL
ncbi:hypothetical protein FHS18_004389 [Paenibacillus phyllosphaerae]|uniref:Uncharacterized protein n=1 Tax=Paenibacillus phyllosphaerae TaxID=274593 RepID=A0A7W5FPI9_9BACL|nr:hypothetical protein [Paenibacillus phyllosphaerae]MBB3112303.1 hypothetical protein [Paenibacillus phyllosphaerae]